MRHWLQKRIDDWVQRRVRRQRGPVIVARGRVYILPTRFGYGFALMNLVMLLGATHYSNSMAFALSFLLCALGLVCMHHTHANLVNVQLRSGRCEPAFAAESLRYEVLIDNPSRRRRYDLCIGWSRTEALDSGDVVAGGSRAFDLATPALQRGLQQAGMFSLSTQFPLGLFRAWTWIDLDFEGLVYPRAINIVSMPPTAAAQGHQTRGGNDGHDDFAGLRPYRVGDSLRLVHWKSLSKRQPPMVKQFEDSASPELWLDWAALPQLDHEARLSQLTHWVLDAQAQARVFGLRLNGPVIAASTGSAHAEQCLRALALFEYAASPVAMSMPARGTST